MDKMRFGDWVRQRREELEFSQSELALEAKLSRSTVNNIEANAIKHLKADTLFKISKALKWNAEQARNAFLDKDPNDSTENQKKEQVYQAAIEFLEKATRTDY
jgi:transcriptional regulator with XRE-family HTH domain